MTSKIQKSIDEYGDYISKQIYGKIAFIMFEGVIKLEIHNVGEITIDSITVYGINEGYYEIIDIDRENTKIQTDRWIGINDADTYLISSGNIENALTLKTPILANQSMFLNIYLIDEEFSLKDIKIGYNKLSTGVIPFIDNSH